MKKLRITTALKKQHIEEISRAVAAPVESNDTFAEVNVFALTVTERELLSAAIAELDFIIENLPFEDHTAKHRLSRVYDQLRKVAE